MSTAMLMVALFSLMGENGTKGRLGGLIGVCGGLMLHSRLINSSISIAARESI